MCVLDAPGRKLLNHPGLVVFTPNDLVLLLSPSMTEALCVSQTRADRLYLIGTDSFIRRLLVLVIVL